MSWMPLTSVVQIDSSFSDEPQYFQQGIPQMFAVHLASIKMRIREMLPENSETDTVAFNIVIVEIAD